MNGRTTGTYRYTYNYYTIITIEALVQWMVELLVHIDIHIITYTIITIEALVQWMVNHYHRGPCPMNGRITGTYRYTYNYYTIITIEALVQWMVNHYHRGPCPMNGRTTGTYRYTYNYYSIITIEALVQWMVESLVHIDIHIITIQSLP